MDRNDTEKLTLGLGIGLLIGATVMLFLAPKSGAETRQIVKDKVAETADAVSAKIKTTVDKVHRK